MAVASRKHSNIFMKINANLCALALALFGTLTAPAADSRCYEMRIYYAAPGKLDDLNKRFREHTCKLFEKHGIENIGYWTPVENTDNKLIYVLAYPNREAREASWKAFMADPDWKAAAKASEANGKLVAKVESRFLSATDYSPAIKPRAAGSPRLFELRTYTVTEGHLPNLDARFREHTVGLFKKHGMENFAYWHLMPGQKGVEDVLVYIVAHQNKEGVEASWKGFRDDVDWVVARKASEEKAGGSLTAAKGLWTEKGVDSVYMTATDYSATK